MTEAEWLTCENPHYLLIELERRAGSRKLRLFCCACVRRIWPRLTDSETSRRAVEVAEAFADECIAPEELAIVERAAEEVTGTTSRIRNAQRAAAWCASGIMDAVGIARSAAEGSINASRKSRKREGAAQSLLLRDIFGNPFRPVAFDPAWRTATAVALAEQMYAGRDFGAMPILADALQDAGCDNPDVLGHGRDATAAHVRGCWVVDMVLGKE